MATRVTRRILSINGGSSSIRFALYRAGEPLVRTAEGKVDRIGLAGTTLTFKDLAGTPAGLQTRNCHVPGSAVEFLLDWLDKQSLISSVIAVGHRIVHGMLRSDPELISGALIEELRGIIPFDPQHLPLEIELIEAFARRYPGVPQVACFDTAFHRTMPRVATVLPIPRRYESMGVRRYGFHGLSYEFLMQELVRIGDPAATRGRVILAHLGNGASIAAIRDGRSIDTSMSFTPASGLMMGSRSGDLDPSLASFMAHREQMSTAQFQDMVHNASGLLGVSETSSDLRELLEREADDVRAAEAIELFCYQVRKWIGSFAAALGGVDTIVFAGGIGERAPSIRWRICEALAFLGVELDAGLNDGNAPVISSPNGRVRVRVIPTDEELGIARTVAHLLKLSDNNMSSR